jgi:flagellum-specific peptidoglycan hydrolase FlgJ
MNQRDFINKIARYAVEDMDWSNVLASITIAQGALESAWGESAPGNNLFGIKGSGTTQSTQEYINGKWVTIKAGFRKYDDWRGSVKDHSQFLVENGRYAKNGFFDACANKDYREAARSLQRAGYATDPGYANKLIGIIEKWDLHEYDGQTNIPEGDQPMTADERQAFDALKQEVAAIKESSGVQPIPSWAKVAVDENFDLGLITTKEGTNDWYRLNVVIKNLRDKNKGK